jgi:hypothetical protein
MRADAGYFAGQLARAAHDAHINFAIGARRIAPLWRLLAGIADDAWHDAIEMDNAQVAVAQYCPDWWPANTRLLIRRVLLEPEQVSADPRSRRRRTLHPDQRALPFPELAQAGPVYAYSFILTNLDVSTPSQAAAAEHWYRHRTTVENLFRDSKLGAALRHLPSRYPQVNLAWMWGALLAASMAAWLHQLTAVTAGEDILAGHGVRGGKAMIATLRWRLIAVPGRLIRHARYLTLRLPPGHSLLPEILARLRDLPAPPDPRTLSPGSPSLPRPASPDPRKPPQSANPARLPGRSHARYQEFWHTKIIYAGVSQLTALFADSGLIKPSASTGKRPARSTPRAGPSRSAPTARSAKPRGRNSGCRGPPSHCRTATASFPWSAPARTRTRA